MRTTRSEPHDLPGRDRADPAPAIEVRGLVKTYQGRRVVDGVDLDVAPGECLALLGPNGAGKTTTVEILEGFRSRDGGHLRVLGMDPDGASRSWRTRVGVVAQGVSVALDLTVAELLRHSAVYHRDPRDWHEVVAAVGLQDAADTRMAHLSGGQRRRLDVALGIQGRPEVLFLDEPTAGMDPQARRAFWGLVRGLRAERVTIVLTTHDLHEAAALADRVAVMSAGRLVQVAAPASLGSGLGLGVRVGWSRDGIAHEVVTECPTATVRSLLAQHDGEVPDLSVRPPTLEDAYLALVAAGTSPR